jgi:hypothetical protein
MKRKRITTGRKKFTSGRAVKIARKDPSLSRINEHAAGIDIGAQSHFVAVPPASCTTPVREFGVFTRDLYVCDCRLAQRVRGEVSCNGINRGLLGATL